MALAQYEIMEPSQACRASSFRSPKIHIEPFRVGEGVSLDSRVLVVRVRTPSQGELLALEVQRSCLKSS